MGIPTGEGGGQLIVSQAGLNLAVAHLMIRHGKFNAFHGKKHRSHGHVSSVPLEKENNEPAMS